MTTSPDSPAVRLSPSNFRAAISAVFLLVLLSALDQLCVSVALPTVAAELGTLDGMAWVISGYMLASTVVTPLYGRFGDMHGHRRVLGVALALFLLGSAGCAMANSMVMLVLARVLQGAGAGGLMTLSQAIIADIVPLRDRGRFAGYLSMIWAVASVIGPVSGGLVTHYFSWRWIFWVNVPLCAIAWGLAARSLRALPPGHGRQPVDWAGAALLMAGLVALLLPITRLGQGVSVTDGPNAAWLAAALVLLWAFWRQQTRTPAPVVPLSLMHNPVVIRGVALLFICFFGLISLTLLVPLRLQTVAGWNVAEAGSFLMWYTLATPTGVYISGRWMGRTGLVRPLQRLGAMLVPLGLIALALMDPALAWAQALAMVAVGMGCGFQLPTNLLMVQNAVARREIGTATALTVLARMLGGAIGIAVLSSLVFALLQGSGIALVRGPEGLAMHGASSMQVSDHAFRVALLVAAALSCVSIWISRGIPQTRLHGQVGHVVGATEA